MCAQRQSKQPIRNILHIVAVEGNQIDYWLARFPRANHTGVDIDPQRVPRLPLDAKLQANGENLPFRDLEFDLAIGIATFHHFQNPLAGMLDCLRVGRTLAFIEPLQTPRG